MNIKNSLICVCLALWANCLQAQPANDAPCNATPLPIIENTDGCNLITYNITGATYSNIPGTFLCGPNPDVWLRFNTPDPSLKIRFGGSNVNFTVYSFNDCSQNLTDGFSCLDSITWSNITNAAFNTNINQLIRVESSTGSPNFSFSICVTLLRTAQSERVGIHTKFPQSNLDVAGKAVFRDTLSVSKTFRYNNGNQGLNKVLTSDNNGYAFWGNPVVNYWTASGTHISNNNSANVGIGTAAPVNKLSVVGNSNITGNLGIGNLAPTRPLSFPPSLGEKILLYPGAAGEVGIGVYGNELRLHADNAGAKVSFGTQDNAGVFTENALAQRNGVFSFSVTGSLWVNGSTYSSDERFKKNIKPIENALQKLMQIRGVEYEMRSEEFNKLNFPQGRQIGLLAQNVEKVIPEAVQEKDGYKGVDYAKLVPLLIESIKTQQTQILTQQKEVGDLKERDKKQQQQIDSLTRLVEELIQK